MDREYAAAGGRQPGHTRATRGACGRSRRYDLLDDSSNASPAARADERCRDATQSMVPVGRMCHVWGKVPRTTQLTREVRLAQAAVRHIPLARPSLGAREQELVIQALDSGVLGLG